jgi:hypothetical protein
VLVTRGDLVVERDPARPSGRLLRQGDMEASYVDLADPRHLEFDYMRWMRIVLRAARARRVLHVGGAACALARALAAEDPDSRQEVYEADAEVLEIARAHLGLRRAPGLRVRHGEGGAAIRAAGDGGFDAIALDAFIGATVPRHLITVEAFTESARVAPLTLVNVVDTRAARDVDAVAAGLAEAYAHVFMLGGRSGNTVVAGSARPPDLDRLAASTAADPSPARLHPPPELARRIRTASALRDAALSQ